ncbi:MAG: 1-acyl-sn-glycerol-3-phosphate acyltransferase [Bdellovibrionales bacterium]|nr:1-acyl-sn-glycerol-3-phosphate acyltransferase [Bdellovibrionales bacterium]
MALLRVFLRSLGFILILSSYSIVSTIIYISFGFNFEKARPYLVHVISIASKYGLKVFNVEVRKTFAPIDPSENFLIVSNHLTYLDVLIISTHFPTSFVTSQEMKETPFLGQICLLGGCLFVERRKRSGLANEVKELSNALVEGINVAIFPEATSTNGEAVIRFKRPLFQAAMSSHSKILPVCLNYRTLDGEKITLKNRDSVFWYDDTPFIKHVLRLFSHKKIVAEFSVMSPIDTSTFVDKSDLAEHCYNLIGQEFEAITHAV